MDDIAPYNNLKNICEWAASLGYKEFKFPWDTRLIDITLAGNSKNYCDEIKGVVNEAGLELTELATPTGAVGCSTSGL